MKTKIIYRDERFLVVLGDRVFARYKTFDAAYNYYVKHTIDPYSKDLMWMGLAIKLKTIEYAIEYKEGRGFNK